jgi:hypothetical protein
MTIKRIIALAISFILIFSMISCDTSNQNSHGSSDPHDQYPHPDQSQATGGNNESEENEEEEGGEGKVTYVYSVLAKMLHLPDCYHVENIKEDYLKEYTGDITVLLQKEYTICRDCLVPDEEEDNDDEEDEEDENLIDKEDATYATNKSNKVIHLLDCYTLESMSSKNLRYSDLTYEELIDLDYRPCGTCMPDEYKQYKEEHPEKFEK